RSFCPLSRRSFGSIPTLHEITLSTERITFFLAAQFASFSKREPSKLAKINTSKLWIRTPIQCVTRTSLATNSKRETGSHFA
ncbi:hypothetical protein, partial [Rhizobium sp. BR 362]|uniref:hypothetical protein n=1 Tax=Rhizobium sp. BR 362 TaxID=3040670 RepID=UPI002F41D013